ncbi:balbiani ring protein 3-like [Microcaecilia unicolor]|uniref:Balbiani ring protein 3-like n=1 Tax=Microcaecilia unicolor TaxID=1415580 RepID=A0A6P7Z1J5_9AMPH|nr:balbiani ring protein 3-like [Microcaecilia unicolor]
MKTTYGIFLLMVVISLATDLISASGILPERKPGICPRPRKIANRLLCPCKDECTLDIDCPENKKCCSDSCEKVCKPPIKDKPGQCPIIDPLQSIIPLFPAPPECSSDYHCPANKKCCLHECVPPVYQHDGQCPQKPDYPKCTEVDPAVDCNSDGDCAEDEKCCDYGCRFQCMQALKEKPGDCPPMIFLCIFPLPEPQCKCDFDCAKEEKCCSLCGLKCVRPREEKPGKCPKPSYIHPSDSSGFCDHFCKVDGDCPSNKKCCDEGCEKVCKPPAADKPGVCPTCLIKEFPEKCSDECTSDSECAGTLKCCFDKCGLACLPCPGETPGFCPPKVLPPGIDVTPCIVNCEHCTEEEKCCPMGCRLDCMKTSQEKPGFCPYDPVRCIRAARSLCTRDSGCPGDEKCCSHMCGTDCVAALSEKPGICPAPTDTCLPLTLSPATPPVCSSDYHCPDDQKCCIKDCEMKCVDPLHDLSNPS